jgi:hypothetical protein
MLTVQVGTSFVQQYYSILCHNTHHLHRFYTDASSFTRAEAGPEGEDQIETVVGQKVSKGIVFPSIEHVFSSFETANNVDGMHQALKTTVLGNFIDSCLSWLVFSSSNI